MALTKIEVLMEKWNVVKVPLAKAGMDVDKLDKKKLQQAGLLAQLEADEMIDEDQERWDEYVEELIRKHPTYATPMFHHRMCAQSLLSEYPGSEWDGNQAPTMEELMEAKYAIVWVGNEGSRYTVTAHATEKDVCAAIARENHSSEDPDYVDAIYELDHDTKIADQRDITIITTVTWKDAEYTVGGDS